MKLFSSVKASSVGSGGTPFGTNLKFTMAGQAVKLLVVCCAVRDCSELSPWIPLGPIGVTVTGTHRTA